MVLNWPREGSGTGSWARASMAELPMRSLYRATFAQQVIFLAASDSYGSLAIEEEPFKEEELSVSREI